MVTEAQDIPMTNTDQIHFHVIPDHDGEMFTVRVYTNSIKTEEYRSDSPGELNRLRRLASTTGATLTESRR